MESVRKYKYYVSASFSDVSSDADVKRLFTKVEKPINQLRKEDIGYPFCGVRVPWNTALSKNIVFMDRK